MFGKSLNINPFELSRRIGRPLILDGAMGSMLQQSGIKSSGSMWMSKINIDNPEVVYKIHEQYINAGADIITTNTFRTNPVAVENSGFRINQNRLVKQSVKIALDAAKDYPVFIAGSNAPAEDCYQGPRNISIKKLKENHETHINNLMESGAHFILNETQSHFDEIIIIAKYCFKNEIPFVMSLFTDEKLKLLSGEKVKDVIKILLDYNPMAIGLNCILPETFIKYFNKSRLNFTWGTYLNCGSGEFTDENIQCGISPKNYGEIIKDLLKKSPSFLGSCCGSSPKHTAEIKKILDEKIRS